MCVALGLLAAGGGAGAAGAATTAGGGGLLGTSFLSGLGLGTEVTNALVADVLFTGGKGYIDMRRTNQQAKFQAEQAVKEAEAADLALAREQEGLGARLKEERKANIQEQLALAKRGAQAAGAVRASERSGLTIDLLLGDVERQEGEAKSLLEQTMESATQQYRRNTLGLKAKRDNRFNVAKSKRNQAQGMAKGGLDVALSTLGSGISSYYGLAGQA